MKIGLTLPNRGVLLGVTTPEQMLANHVLGGAFPLTA